jgi:hypothetical protein
MQLGFQATPTLKCTIQAYRLAFQSWGRQVLDGRLWCWIWDYLLSNSLLRHEDVFFVSEVAIYRMQ